MRAARPAAPVLGDDEPLRPRASDLSGFGRHIARRLLGIARSDQPTGLAKLLVDHLGPEVRSQPVVSDRWPAYDRVNVQLGLEAWLGGATSSAVSSARVIRSSIWGLSPRRWLSRGLLVRAASRSTYCLPDRTVRRSAASKPEIGRAH